MKVITDTCNLALENTVVVLGNFDGIHKGHLSLLHKAKKLANRHSYKTVFFTFSPHPTHVLDVEEVELIYTLKEKQRIARQEGMDYFVSYTFTKETAHMNPKDFINEFLVKKLGVRAIVVGEDYRFGKKRAGSIELLRKYEELHQFKVYPLEKLTYNDKIISSTWIRETIEKANMELAKELMGRNYFLLGTVVHGSQIGRTIGFPTANIKPAAYKKLPPNGVYLTKVIYNNIEYYSLTNIGTKPTIDKKNKEVIVETYIHDFHKMIYDEEIIVVFYHYLRPEEVYDGLDTLKTQIHVDMNALEEFFSIK